MGQEILTHPYPLFIQENQQNPIEAHFNGMPTCTVDYAHIIRRR
jgi:hypothetical protein